jgi:ABC-type dipeptide/oligopeptide/nickel transport system ATPase subunit
VGSEKDTLLLDDPVSSLDLTNHYKIAFEIVKKSSSNKKIIVLTHSIELINVINSQYPQNPHFSYFYLEEENSKISIQEIDNKIGANIITLRNLSGYDKIGIIKDLIEKSTDYTMKNPIHKLFH